MLWAFDCKILAEMGVPPMAQTKGACWAVLTRGPSEGQVPSSSVQATNGAPLPEPRVYALLSLLALL